MKQDKSILAVDIGNTNASLAVFRNCSADMERWETAARADAPLSEPDSLARALQTLGGGISGAVIGSVAGEKHSDKTAAMVESALGMRPLVADCSMQTGLTHTYKTPETLGIDRLANAAALFAICGGACVAVDFGTATTFDCVSDKGVYMGGAIAPGLGSFRAALSAAPALPDTGFDFPPSPLAQTTEDCVRSGTMFGYARMVDGMAEAMAGEMGAPRARVVATGGFARAVCGECRSVSEVDDLLTLKGLAIILIENEGLLSV